MNDKERTRFANRGMPRLLMALLFLLIAAWVGLSAQPLWRGSDSEPADIATPNESNPWPTITPHGPLTSGATPVNGVGRGVSLQTGMSAPDLVLPAFQGDERFHLASHRGSKPVVLVLGSFTCDLLQARLKDLNALYAACKDRAAFAFINVTEAGHEIPGFEFLLETRTIGVTPEEYQKRRHALQRAREQAKMQWPCFMDLRGGDACAAYSALPARLVIVGVDGRIAHDFGCVVDKEWNPAEMKQVLESEIGRSAVSALAAH